MNTNLTTGRLSTCSPWESSSSSWSHKILRSTWGAKKIRDIRNSKKRTLITELSTTVARETTFTITISLISSIICAPIIQKTGILWRKWKTILGSKGKPLATNNSRLKLPKGCSKLTSKMKRSETRIDKQNKNKDNNKKDKEKCIEV